MTIARHGETCEANGTTFSAIVYNSQEVDETGGFEILVNRMIMVTSEGKDLCSGDTVTVDSTDYKVDRIIERNKVSEKYELRCA